MSECGRSSRDADGSVATSGPGGSNQVNFMVALPDRFSQRYFFVGLGGSAGFVPDPPAEQLRSG